MYLPLGSFVCKRVLITSAGVTNDAAGAPARPPWEWRTKEQEREKRKSKTEYERKGQTLKKSNTIEKQKGGYKRTQNVREKKEKKKGSTHCNK